MHLSNVHYQFFFMLSRFRLLSSLSKKCIDLSLTVFSSLLNRLHVKKNMFSSTTFSAIVAWCNWDGSAKAKWKGSQEIGVFRRTCKHDSEEWKRERELITKKLVNMRLFGNHYLFSWNEMRFMVEVLPIFLFPPRILLS